ncbi:MAG: T9SS type A sorting domain-containing protein [Gammaproteobacteria bacterium]|nr:T9SS type A sorting domain-containing protein [Gammaproteobacteria bacterium]NIW96997.1 T9SS type A sorting domain-containing protein [Phycisphaerae bacterium]
MGGFLGTSGTILRTTNGGQDWFAQSSGTSHQLGDVFLMNPDTAIAVGFQGTILRTTDGGNNWSPVASGTSTEFLQSLHFSNAIHGTVVGTGGFIARTTNGGKSWTPQTSGTATTLVDVYFSDENTGTVVGGPLNFPGVILRTTNGGATWTPQSIGATGSIQSVGFLDNDNGMVVGQEGLGFFTTDGGKNWNKLATNTINDLASFTYTTTDTGIVVGAGGTILRFRSDSPTGIKNNPNPGTEKPGGFVLKQNYPNPFNPSTRIEFSVPERVLVRLTVYDLQGRKITTLLEETRNAGDYSVTWNAKGYASGFYIYQLEAGKVSKARKLLYLK